MMKKLLVMLMIPVAATVAALAVASPANAAAPRQVGYLDQFDLNRICWAAGGYFSADPGGGSHFCVLPDGRVILCMTSTRNCVVIERTAPKPGGWRPVVSDLLIQGDPVVESTPVLGGVAVRGPLVR